MTKFRVNVVIICLILAATQIALWWVALDGDHMHRFFEGEHPHLLAAMFLPTAGILRVLYHLAGDK